MKRMIKMARKFARPFRVTDDGFRLKDIDPGDTLNFTSEDKPRAKEALAMGVDVLSELQEMLYAQDRWAVLLIFQAMDAAGKDGAIEQTNFDTYNSMRISEMPKVEAIVMPSGGFWGGVGEPTICVAAPAVLNAYAAATGKRIRNFPLKNHDISFA